ncbi:MAG TPA: HD domain-containing phosphohydrolase [Thermoanaerobaculia bacterium]|nr:HD domain-containing phosphohydrolase [Thermoanaerobaculia bacterium]
MNVEYAALEPKLKEILYNCLEQIRATKAALYLSNGEGPYSLVAQYGFRDNVRKIVALNDDLVDRLLTKRAPVVVNGLAAEPRFSELLYQSDTTRMLVAPIYSLGRLFGFVDMRDKAGQQPFEAADIDNAQRISEQFLELLASSRAAPDTSRQGSKQPVEEPSELRSPLVRLIEEARGSVARGSLRNRGEVRSLNEAQVNAGGAMLPALVALPNVVMASLNAFSTVGGTQIVCARATVSDEAASQFQAKVRAWLQKRGELDKVGQSTTVYPFGTNGPRIEAARLVSMLSAPVRVQNIPGIVLSVAFDAPPTPDSRSALERFLAQLEEVLRFAVSSDKLKSLMQRAAERLVEPDFQKYPVLAAHSSRVSDLAERLATLIDMSADDIETVRIAALVHDVGMRLINYDKLYRKEQLTSDDLNLFREHSLIGAAIIADSPLGGEIANIVLCHHERFDGTGYPNGVPGDQIPLGSRIIHLCETFDAMTAPDSYQTPVPAISALGKIRRSSGTQFDSVLTDKFVEMMSKP